MNSTTSLEHDISDADQRIASIQKQLGSLGERKQEAISKGDEAAAIKTVRDRGSLESQLEEAKIRRGILTAKAETLKKNEAAAQAAEIRERIALNLLPKAVANCELLYETYQMLAPVLRRMNDANYTMEQLAKEHLKLTGENIELPQLGLPDREDFELRKYLESGQYNGNVSMVPIKLEDLKLVQDVALAKASKGGKKTNV